MALSPSLRTAATWLVLGLVLIAGSVIFILQSSSAMPQASAAAATAKTTEPRTPPADLETATFGTGCFWCSQAVLQRVKGVWEVTCGYMGGHVPNPTYEEVCSHTTGHIEVVQVKFDPKVISYEDLLEWFWHMHDPTTKDRQGADEGEQYRSVIFYYSPAQKAAAEKSMAAAQKNFPAPIVTEIRPAAPFYSAEAYHQEYFNNNPNAGYCRVIIAPKLDKLKLTKAPTTATDAK